MTTELKTIIKDNQHLPLEYTLKMLKEQPECVGYKEGVWLDQEPELVEKLVAELDRTTQLNTNRGLPNAPYTLSANFKTHQLRCAII